MKNCLLVDDSRIVRKVAKQIFDNLGFDCSEAEDGLQALEQCSKSMPDVILLDWNMPVMNGLEFLITLRSTPGGDAPQVIFCTTENDMAHIREALTHGANEYIMKPFDADIIRSKLEQLDLLEIKA